MTDRDEGQKWWINLATLPDEALEVLVQARRRDLKRLDVTATERDLSTVEQVTRTVVTEALDEIAALRDQRSSGAATTPEMSEGRVASLSLLAHVSMEGAVADQVEQRLRTAA